MASYRISQEAQRDLEQHYESGITLFGLAQADRYLDELYHQFQLLADFPGIGGRPLDIPGRKYYRLRFASHVIIYTKMEPDVRIERIFHGRMDYLRHL